MANPTSNFGWQMPTNTDLVKDLPADFEVFGQAVDTSLMDLKGGTTGQVLSKASNTDMDFTWVAQDDSNAIQNALLTTTGDTIYASAASTPARLGIGTTGQVLTVAGGVPSWATPSSGGMTLLSTTTLSGATVTISNISQSYKDLFLIVSGVTNATADGRLRIAVNGSTSTTTTTQFNSSSNNFLLFNNDYLLLSPQNLTRTDANNAWAVSIHNYASTTAYKPVQMYGNAVTTGASPGKNGFGTYDSNTAVTSLVFSNGGGNLSTGTVLLYGVS